MARPSNTKKRRAQITKAFIKVMAEHGYDGTSTSQVATEAGFTHGLIHYHFKSKQNILLAVINELSSNNAKRLQQKLFEYDDPIKQLSGYIDFHVSLEHDANPEALACWIVLTGEALRKAEVKEAYNKVMEDSKQCLISILKEGIKQKVFQCQDVDSSASALIAAIQGYFVLSATAPTMIPQGSASESIKKMAEGLLRPLRFINTKSGSSKKSEKEK